MNRRQFLSFASMPIAAAVVIPELTRTIFLPPRGGWPVLARDALYWVGTDREVYGYDGVAVRAVTAAQFRATMGAELQRIWREVYEEGIVLDDGRHVKFAEDWPAIYGTSS